MDIEKYDWKQETDKMFNSLRRLQLKRLNKYFKFRLWYRKLWNYFYKWKSNIVNPFITFK